MSTTSFECVPVGGVFWCNGNACVKRSERTALLIQYGRWFYFEKATPVLLKDNATIDREVEAMLRGEQV